MLSWTPLKDKNQLEQLIKNSQMKPVAIYKHSTRCGTSAAVKHRLERLWDIPPAALDMYYLDVIRQKLLSDQVASCLNITHASPQLLLLSDGKVIFETSHSAITVDAIKDSLSIRNKE